MQTLYQQSLLMTLASVRTAGIARLVGERRRAKNDFYTDSRWPALAGQYQGLLVLSQSAFQTNRRAMVTR
jgi:hypothetical protein